MRTGTDKKNLERFLRFTDNKWIVSSNIWGCPEGQSKVYLRRKVGKSGGLQISGCIANEEAKRLKHELREYIRQRKA